MGYSAGFSPHPKISWHGAAPTSAGSEAEYVELGLAVDVDLDALRDALDAALPPGLDVLSCVPASAVPLTDLVDASRWQIRLPGVAPGELETAVAALLAADSILVERSTKAGKRLVDARAAVVRAVCRAEHPDCAILEVVVRHTTPAVRPDDVLTALGVVAVLQPPVYPEPVRLEQGRLREDGSLADPLDPDGNDAGRTASRLEA
jgi:radical SAM-linked protein